MIPFIFTCFLELSCVRQIIYHAYYVKQIITYLCLPIGHALT